MTKTNDRTIDVYRTYVSRADFAENTGICLTPCDCTISMPESEATSTYLGTYELPEGYRYNAETREVVEVCGDYEYPTRLYGTDTPSIARGDCNGSWFVSLKKVR